MAAFNHPNICHIHDVGPNYIVMEFIDGAPLTGPLPVEKAVVQAGLILEEVVQNIRSWKHSGFSVDQSVRLEAGDREGTQRLAQYFLR